MKGRKPIAVIMDGEKIICPTWKRVFAVIIGNCNEIDEKHARLMALRNQYLGRKRVILSDNKNNMKSPLKIGKALYVEAHYDTQTLINLLLRILRDIDYDYREIKVMIRP